MLEKKFKKGYPNDAGVDVICEKDYTFLPLSMTTVEMDVNCTPIPNTCAMLVARTSAAKRGLIISMCPIDADYTGKLTAIVFNGTQKQVTYTKGESFAQIVFLQLAPNTISQDNIFIKNPTKTRGDNKIGSTD